MPKKNADAKKSGEGKKGSAAQRALAALNLPRDFPLGKPSAKALAKHPVLAELAAIALEALAGEIRARVKDSSTAAPKRKTVKAAAIPTETPAPAAPTETAAKPAAPKPAAPKPAAPKPTVAKPRKPAAARPAVRKPRTPAS
ncbi:hypothetical protein GO308_05730 [Sphingomonas sp. SFZ2018-12]|uniref:hypothetical protein n=1 Tax=Sphingomonas sp. SFZ2018-12 TaxID=2683197 RepID=UPI001F0F732D|nr:hypothetical protein [Sphingomonas sp. SFZ2018-12]MCH4892609.1 hypothetical protein [Sphingomonas sp. SFZ2018-12]